MINKSDKTAKFKNTLKAQELEEKNE